MKILNDKIEWQNVPPKLAVRGAFKALLLGLGASTIFWSVIYTLYRLCLCCLFIYGWRWYLITTHGGWIGIRI